MDNPRDTEAAGPFEARYLAFLETITQIRPRLHRYCSRMTGSVMDGEDVAQDALFEAYRKLDQYDDSRPLAPWLFRIAHNRCIDFLRRRGVRVEAETAAMSPDFVMPLRVHQYLQRKPIITIPATAEQLSLSAPTVAKALQHMVKLGMVRETTGKQRHRLFTYRRYLDILNQGTEVPRPSR